MNFDKYFAIPNCNIPQEILASINNGDNITVTDFENCNDILTKPDSHYDVGYSKMSNGDYLVAMYCPMPNVTKEMIDWWFWWHPQKKDRYRLWYPGEHFSISYSKKDKEYFSKIKCPEFSPNLQFPVEKIGKITMPLAINFQNPTDFGFNKDTMNNNNVETIVCGHVGALKGIIQHTEMAHIFFKHNDGLLLVSRFWIGKRLKNPIVRKIILNDETAIGMTKHCCVEYRNLAKKLPLLYEEYK